MCSSIYEDVTTRESNDERKNKSWKASASTAKAARRDEIIEKAKFHGRWDDEDKKPRRWFLKRKQGM